MLQGTCGESCFPNVMYDEYLTVNANLLPSERLYPCHNRGYDTYVNTITYGEPSLTMDIYEKAPKMTEEKCCEGKFNIVS